MSNRVPDEVEIASAGQEKAEGAETQVDSQIAGTRAAVEMESPYMPKPDQIRKGPNGQWQVHIELLLPFFNREFLLDHRINPRLTGPKNKNYDALCKMYFPVEIWAEMETPITPGALRQMIIENNPQFAALRDNNINVTDETYRTWVADMIARHGEWLDINV